MIRSLAIACLLLVSIPALAQQQAERVYTLNLPASQMEALWMAIRKAPIPREVTDPLVAEIAKQVKQHDEVAEKARQKSPDQQ